MKEYCFDHTKILIPPAGMKDLLKKYVSTTRKNCFHLYENTYKKRVENGFHPYTILFIYQLYFNVE